ncbi:unnamed protein product, partial [Vitis vinifera]
MISSWRRRRAGRRAAKLQQHAEDDIGSMELTTPNHFRCPISLDLMKDPVTLSTGITYDRESIEMWIEAGNRTCPITNQVLRSLEPIPNHTIRKMIQDWCVENRSFGIERIPTPRIPLSSVEVTDMLSKFKMAYRREDEAGCRELVAKMKSKGKESERNKRCIVINGAAGVLSAAFEAFSSASFDKYVAVLEDILAALTWMSPLDGEAKSYLSSAASLNLELLLELLVDSEKSVCEKALGVLDGICGCEEGREKAYGHALTMPVLVKKLLRVSDLATEFSVSILWKLSKNEKREDGSVLVEALQVGAFQKLLLLLQVGCSDRTKEKATELLKLLNIHRERLECIDSMDFKDLKRPF